VAATGAVSVSIFGVVALVAASAVSVDVSTAAVLRVVLAGVRGLVARGRAGAFLAAVLAGATTVAAASESTTAVIVAGNAEAESLALLSPSCGAIKGGVRELSSFIAIPHPVCRTATFRHFCLLFFVADFDGRLFIGRKMESTASDTLLPQIR
jgi:hypothetical protein